MIEIRDSHYDVKGRECLCRGCDRVFTGLDGFDAHRVKGRCVEPSTKGYRLDWQGRWTKGMGNKPRLSQALLDNQYGQ